MPSITHLEQADRLLQECPYLLPTWVALEHKDTFLDGLAAGLAGEPDLIQICSGPEEVWVRREVREAGRELGLNLTDNQTIPRHTTLVSQWETSLAEQVKTIANFLVKSRVEALQLLPNAEALTDLVNEAKFITVLDRKNLFCIQIQTKKRLDRSAVATLAGFLVGLRSGLLWADSGKK